MYWYIYFFINNIYKVIYIYTYISVHIDIDIYIFVYILKIYCIYICIYIYIIIVLKTYPYPLISTHVLDANVCIKESASLVFSFTSHFDESVC